MAEDILVANESFSFRYQGADIGVVKDVTRVRKGHPMLVGVEHLFKPIEPHFEYASVKAEKPKVEEKKAEKPEFVTATAAPNEKR